MNILFFDDSTRAHLYPLAFTRPVSEFRMGILTNSERWKRLAQHYYQQIESDPIAFRALSYGWITEDYLQSKYPPRIGAKNLLINGKIIQNLSLVQQALALQPGTALMYQEKEILAAHLSINDAEYFAEHQQLPAHIDRIAYELPVLAIERLWHLFQHNEKVLAIDFELLTIGRQSQPLSASNTVIGDRQRIFLEEGATAEACILNPASSYIYLAKGAELMEGTIVRGGLSLGEGAQTKLGTKIYGATTIGPYSKMGGEVSNSVIFGYSNKAHDGFLGNSVLGEWCNLGAGTNNSNLKNNYGKVELWSYVTDSFEDTGAQFCGLMMGDHSKCGITTMFNTGTVVGVFANIFGDGFPRKFVPSFSWGGAKGFSTYELEKAYETASLVLERRHLALDDDDKHILKTLFQRTAHRRSWDKTKG